MRYFLFSTCCAHDGVIYPKTALVDEEDATFYGKESFSVDESFEVDVDEPSSVFTAATRYKGLLFVRKIDYRKGVQGRSKLRQKNIVT